MSDMNDPNQTQSNSTIPPAGFCQNCGKPLDTDTICRVGPAVYCEPCLAARLGETPTGPGAVPPPPGTPGGYGPASYGATGTWSAGAASWASSFNSARPNPGLAALLGLIPGVGAMYNEQYAKGIIHLVVFAVLVSLADNVNGIFGLFVAGWVFYMAIEAHHTARARRDGTPLPNPFGLNDIGERLGFGKAWPSGPTVTEVANDAAAAAAQGFHNAQRPSASYQPVPPQPAATSWGAPTDAYAPPHGAYPNAYQQAGYAEQFAQATQAQAYRDAGYVPPPVPPAASAYGAPPYTPVPPFDPSAFAAQPSRFPAGAIWLIGLGTIFLLTTTGIFNGFPGEALIGCILLGICVWIFLRRMFETGVGLQNDGSPGYALRVLRAVRGSIWLGAFGLLFLLDAFHILIWHHSWPFLIILAGVMALLQRAAFQTSSASYAPTPAPVSAAPAPDSTDLTKRGF